MFRIFLVGCPRSGTTLVQSLVASAQGIATFPESHFFDRCFNGALLAMGIPHFSEQCVVETSRRIAGNSQRETTFQARDGHKRRSGLSVASAFVALLDGIAIDQSATGWVEKTPDHLRRVRLIKKAAPDAKIVHVMRAPGPTIASLQKASAKWGKPRGWFAFAIKWWISASISSFYIGKEGHTHVFYEEMVQNTQEETRRVFHELGLAWDEGVLDRYKLTAEKAIDPNEPWKANNVRDIRSRTTEQPNENWLQRPILSALDTIYSHIKAKHKKN